jgi:hypothetical protein
MATVVVIINHKEELSTYEKISLTQCIKVLSRRQVWMVVPDDLNTDLIQASFSSIKILRVKSSYLSNYRNFNRFKINPFLYEYFSDYQYLLYYELDAFVFSDQLDEWCAMGYDYIGAPWIAKDKSFHFLGVGNGGLSLRKISSHKRVLRTFCRLQSNLQTLKWYSNFNLKGKVGYFSEFLLRLLGLRGNTRWQFNDYRGNEDEFWSHMGSLFSWFKIPDAAIALQFSFEMCPEELFVLNGNKLPFGCHAWYKGDQINFWRPFIIKEGYTLGDENS